MEVDVILHAEEKRSNNPVLSLTYGRLSNNIFAGYKDGNIRQFDVSRGVISRVLFGHSGWVTGLHFSDERRCLFSVSLDGKICCWSIRGDVLDVRKVGSPLYCVTWNPNCDHILVGSVGNLEVFFLKNSDIVGMHPCLVRVDSLDSHFDIVSAVAVSENRVYTASYDGSILIRDANYYSKIREIINCGGAIADLGFNLEKQVLYTLNFRQDVRFWTMEGDPIKAVHGIRETMRNAVFSKSTDSLWIASTLPHPVVIEYKAKKNITQNMPSNFYPTASEARFVSYILSIPDGFKSEKIERIIGGMSDGSLIIWKFNIRACLQVMQGHTEAVESIEYFIDTSELYPKLMLFSISADRTLREWTLQLDSESPDLQFRIRGEQKHTPTCLYVRSEHEEVFVGCEDGSIAVWDACGMERRPGKVIKRHTDSVNGIRFWRNYLVSCSSDGFVRIYDIQREQLVRSLSTEENETFLGIDICEKRNEAGTYGISNVGYIWNLVSGTIVYYLHGHEAELYQITYISMQDIWVTFSADHSLRSWDARGNSLQKFSFANEYLVGLIAPRETDMILISTLSNRVVGLEILPDGRLESFVEFVATEGNVKSLCYVREQKMLYVGSEDGKIRTWMIDNPVDFRADLFRGNPDLIEDEADMDDVLRSETARGKLSSRLECSNPERTNSIGTFSGDLDKQSSPSSTPQTSRVDTPHSVAQLQTMMTVGDAKSYLERRRRSCPGYTISSRSAVLARLSRSNSFSESINGIDSSREDKSEGCFSASSPSDVENVTDHEDGYGVIPFFETEVVLKSDQRRPSKPLSPPLVSNLFLQGRSGSLRRIEPHIPQEWKEQEKRFDKLPELDEFLSFSSESPDARSRNFANLYSLSTPPSGFDEDKCSSLWKDMSPRSRLRALKEQGLSHKVAVGLSSKHQGKMMRQFHTIVDEALDLVGAESSISSSKISPAPKQVLVSNANREFRGFEREKEYAQHALRKISMGSKDVERMTMTEFILSGAERLCREHRPQSSPPVSRSRKKKYISHMSPPDGSSRMGVQFSSKNFVASSVNQSTEEVRNHDVSAYSSPESILLVDHAASLSANDSFNGLSLHQTHLSTLSNVSEVSLSVSPSFETVSSAQAMNSNTNESSKFSGRLKLRDTLHVEETEKKSSYSPSFLTSVLHNSHSSESDFRSRLQSTSSKRMTFADDTKSSYPSGKSHLRRSRTLPTVSDSLRSQSLPRELPEESQIARHTSQRPSNGASRPFASLHRAAVDVSNSHLRSVASNTSSVSPLRANNLTSKSPNVETSREDASRPSSHQRRSSRILSDRPTSRSSHEPPPTTLLRHRILGALPEFPVAPSVHRVSLSRRTASSTDNVGKASDEWAFRDGSAALAGQLDEVMFLHRPRKEE